MMGITTLGKKYYRMGQRRARREALRLDLLNFPDELLEDMGVSRDRLHEGVGAWPWKVAAATS